MALSGYPQNSTIIIDSSDWEGKITQKQLNPRTYMVFLVWKYKKQHQITNFQFKFPKKLPTQVLFHFFILLLDATPIPEFLEAFGFQQKSLTLTWRIIPVSRLVPPNNKPWNGHLEGVPQPYQGDLPTIFINHFLIGIILQVAPFCPLNRFTLELGKRNLWIQECLAKKTPPWVHTG